MYPFIIKIYLRREIVKIYTVQPIDGWKTKTDIFDFDLKKHYKNIVPQGVTTRLKKDWIKKIYKQPLDK